MSWQNWRANYSLNESSANHSLCVMAKTICACVELRLNMSTKMLLSQAGTIPNIMVSFIFKYLGT